MDMLPKSGLESTLRCRTKPREIFDVALVLRVAGQVRGHHAEDEGMPRQRGASPAWRRPAWSVSSGCAGANAGCGRQHRQHDRKGAYGNHLNGFDWFAYKGKARDGRARSR